MQKDIRTLKDGGLVQVTLVDERWYARPKMDEVTGLPATYEFVPSVTWICGFYPKGIGFYKWLANTGWDEAQAIKEAAGGRGSKVHLAIEALINGVPVSMQDSFNNPNTGKDEPLTLEEYEALLSFKGWWDKAKPKVVSQNVTVWSKEFGYAGTLDLVCLIEGKLWIVDFKTSQSVWMSHEIQVSAYKHANPAYEGASLSILQLA